MGEYSGDLSQYRVYWFARDLVASSLGSYATKETDTLRRLSAELETGFDRKQNLSPNEIEEQRVTSEIL
jgi:hypothetical protein